MGNVLWFREVSRGDVGRVGGKNASLGEMVRELGRHGIAVPDGFATTADAFRAYIAHNDLAEVIRRALADYTARKRSLAQAGAAIRAAILKGDWPTDIEGDIRTAYARLSKDAGIEDLSVAVRSSATAEDLPDASFAGQQETYLNMSGEAMVLGACRRCYASLFTDRAIAYREAKGFDHLAVALSVGVQRMVRSDIGGSGVMFSIDTETGCEDVVLIDAAWGLGENVVQGAVDPDEIQVFKPLLDKAGTVPIIEKTRGAKAIKMVYAQGGERPVKNVPTSLAERDAFVLSDEEALTLARWAVEIERHYECPMDMEWARDGETGDLFIVQARPETVQSRASADALRSYSVGGHGPTVAEGLAIGTAAVSAPVCLIRDVAEIERFVDGAILVTEITDPDWVPIMKRASAIVTDHGGRTSHAAIVSRELGLPAIVGTGDATYRLHDEQVVTVSCAEGDQGFVYEGEAAIAVEDVRLDDVPETRTKVMLNLANPAAALRWWRLPSDGVGLARIEFVINNAVKAHPMALLHPERTRPEEREALAALTRGYETGEAYFVDRLSRGLSRIAAAAWPNPCIIRMSDFKTNEYASLLGGSMFEPKEANPMIGFRGAARYTSDLYRDGFALECRAIERLRKTIGLDNVVVMIPFCRTLEEADGVLEIMAANGLRQGRDGLEVYMMVEIPANVVLAYEFGKIFDGFSIGSNDLTQLTLGVDRDSDLLAGDFDERDAAVQWMIGHAIDAARKSGTKIGLCGQGPSDHPEIAEFLVAKGIDTISVTPDSFVAVKRHVAKAEERMRCARAA